MKNFILTGAPGAGKTAILRQLELDGFAVVEEAATDLIALRQAEGIAEPWTQPGFVEDVADLQRRRFDASSHAPGDVRFHDRSLFCTFALARYLDVPFPDGLLHEIQRLIEQGIYQKQILFIRNLGFVEPTAARRITFEETLRFERFHEDVYRAYGFDLISIEPAPLAERVGAIRAAIPVSR
ncbi:MAG TPA: AAA family ATPase [Bryobacteraceae bacterium]|nr:AAA family ATPase [Bryobacteraceae bacterium]